MFLMLGNLQLDKARRYVADQNFHKSRRDSRICEVWMEFCCCKFP